MYIHASYIDLWNPPYPPPPPLVDSLSLFLSVVVACLCASRSATLASQVFRSGASTVARKEANSFLDHAFLAVFLARVFRSAAAVASSLASKWQYSLRHGGYSRNELFGTVLARLFRSTAASASMLARTVPMSFVA